MDKVFFKIIIPNYNNMPYIKQCLDSILNQTFQDFKIIIVDDLSTDMSDKFCEMYARKYPKKIHFIQVTEKRYAGGCRNIGIDFQLSSQYTLFVDGDDYLTNANSLMTIYKSIVSSMPDVLLFNWCQDRNGKIERRQTYKFEDFTECRLAACNWNSTWSKAVRTEFVQKCLENCMHGEDTYAWLKLYSKNPTIEQIHDCIYTYRLRNDSVVHDKTSMYVTTHQIYLDSLQQLYYETSSANLKQSIAQLIFRNYFIQTKTYSRIPHIESYRQTLDDLLNSNKSFIRFGDGEFNIIHNKPNVFEKQHNVLKQRLLSILKTSRDDILVGIPFCYFYKEVELLDVTRKWIDNVIQQRLVTDKYLDDISTDITYGDAYLTIMPTQTSQKFLDFSNYFNGIKHIFKEKNVVIVSGDNRVKNYNASLFELAKTVEFRIFDMQKDSFQHYDKILAYATCNIPDNAIYVIAFGPTGKVLAYDLTTKYSVRTFDAGHLLKIYQMYITGKLSNLNYDRKSIWKD